MSDPSNDYPMKAAIGAPELLIVRYKEIEVRPESGSPVQSLPDGRVEVDVTALLAPEDIGGWGIIFSETTEAICTNYGQVSVPGGSFIEPFVQNRASEHYAQYCVPTVQQPPGSLCQQWGGVGGTGNLYKVTVQCIVNGQNYSSVQDECIDYTENYTVTIFEFGPIYEVFDVLNLNGFGECGEFGDWSLYLRHGVRDNVCDVKTTWLATTTNAKQGSFTVTNVSYEGGDWTERCPPLGCVVRPAPPLVPFEFDAEEDDGLPAGEHAVTTIIVEGKDGKDGKDVVLSNLYRNPYGQGSFFAIVGQTETENTYDLYLEDQLESQVAQIATGVCDIVTGEFTREIIDVVVPIIGGTGGYGAAFAAIANMVIELADKSCRERTPPLKAIDGGARTGTTASREVITYFATNRPPEYEFYNVVIIVNGNVQPYPTSADIDTFDTLGSEGVFGIAYEIAPNGFAEPNPRPLRFPSNVYTNNWAAFAGVKVSLPAQANYTIAVQWVVKDE